MLVKSIYTCISDKFCTLWNNEKHKTISSTQFNYICIERTKKYEIFFSEMKFTILHVFKKKYLKYSWSLEQNIQ